MLFIAQAGVPDRHMKKRLIALAVLLCFLVVSLLSGMFIFTHTDHEHDHNGVHGSCAVCEQINNFENLRKQLSMAASGTSFALLSLFAVVSTIQCIDSRIESSSLVALKIRMNN